VGIAAFASRQNLIAVNLALIADGSQDQSETRDPKEVTQESLSFSGEPDLLVSYPASRLWVEKRIRYISETIVPPFADTQNCGIGGDKGCF